MDDKDLSKENEVVTQDNGNKDEGKPFKVFDTEEEYQNAVNKMFRSKLPPKEEFEEFKTWKESQKTEQQKFADLQVELEKSKNSNSSYEHLIEVIDSGVSKEFREFVSDKVGRMEGEFTKNLKDFLKNNPKMLESTQPIKTVNTAPKMNGTTNNLNSTNQIMNDLIRSSRN